VRASATFSQANKKLNKFNRNYINDQQLAIIYIFSIWTKRIVNLWVQSMALKVAKLEAECNLEWACCLIERRRVFLSFPSDRREQIINFLALRCGYENENNVLRGAVTRLVCIWKQYRSAAAAARNFINAPCTCSNTFPNCISPHQQEKQAALWIWRLFTLGMRQLGDPKKC